MYINFNGHLLEESKSCISPSNRSFRYGDGFFETMKMVAGEVALQELHLARLFYSLEVLQFDVPASFSAAYIIDQVKRTATKNKLQHCRIRLNIFRGNGGLYDAENMRPNFVVQVYALEHQNQAINSNGLVVDIFRDSIKAADKFSAIKSNNFLPYAMAALWVKSNKLNDALLLNQHATIADSTIANVFVVIDRQVKTPSLADGAVNGVMRMHLLQCLRKDGIVVQECSLTEEDLNNANEVFLTNAIRGIQWVKQIGKSNYINKTSVQLFNDYVRPLSTR
jgi:aminodeoxychorismate lyase